MTMQRTGLFILHLLTFLVVLGALFQARENSRNIQANGEIVRAMRLKVEALWINKTLSLPNRTP